MTVHRPSSHRIIRSLALRLGAPVVAITTALAAGPAGAYVGDSFISIPGSSGHYRGKHHKDWIRAEAHDWMGRTAMTRRLNSGPTDPLAGDKLFFGGPAAPRPGTAGKLVISLGKTNPDHAQLMARCASKAAIPDLTYAESSDRARPVLELGPRPAEFPDYWEYKLKNVQVVDCPVVERAIEQAFVLAFQDIEWLNFDPNRPNWTKIVVKPEDFPDVRPAALTPNKKVKSYLVTWLGLATDGAEDQCPVMNTKPGEDEVFRFLTTEEAAAEKAKYGEKGVTAGTQTETRGPNKLNAVLLPGIVPDPGLHEPQTQVSLGIDLDGNDGSGPPPKGIRKHRNFVSPDGRTGIDNQYQRIAGCVAGYRGKKGYANQTGNARRADGNITTLVEVSGIDDERNDDSIEVALINSMDKPIRDNSGSKFIAYYTFRPSGDPNFALYNVRLRGRIVDGVILTDPVPKLRLTQGQSGLLEMVNARLRLEIQADGSMKGVLAGYKDWKGSMASSGYSEGLFGYQTPGIYYAMKRLADGMYDPATGEYNGISTVYEIDGVPAFLTSAPPVRVAQDSSNPKDR